ncbi:MAG: CHAD domain-containing protein [Burkholderiales bacterium]|nr:CHAD domain-containing protein [Burkholderiales bacterium]
MNSGRRARADVAVATEVELKLRFPPSQLCEVLALPGLSGAQRGSTRRLTATYYDTPALDLWQRRIALRVRREGGRWVQTVKGGGSAVAGLHSRLEIDTLLTGALPELSHLPRHPVTRILRSRKVAKSLEPVFHTEVTRSLRLLEPAPGVRVEASIDRGTLRSGRRRRQLCEIELELKSGPASALFDLARQLASRIPVALEHRSKAQRGYVLYRGAEEAPVKALAPGLGHAMTAGEAFRTIAGNALAQVHANEHGLIHGDTPEYLHQMRVGIRRLRSAFRLFRDLLGEEAELEVGALRDIAAALAPARDWDVLVIETLPAAADALTREPAAVALLELCEQQRRRARAAAIRSIKADGYRDSMIALGRLLAMLAEQRESGAWRQSARECAAQILGLWHARVLKRGRRIDRRSSTELHRLRIAVKQLRYAIEFFNGLFASRRMTTLRERLARLQDILGHINDAASVAPLLESAAAVGGPDARAAAERVIAWCDERAANERVELRAAWRRFRAASLPWLE